MGLPKLAPKYKRVDRKRCVWTVESMGVSCGSVECGVCDSVDCGIGGVYFSRSSLVAKMMTDRKFSVFFFFSRGLLFEGIV